MQISRAEGAGKFYNILHWNTAEIASRELPARLDFFVRANRLAGGGVYCRLLLTQSTYTNPKFEFQKTNIRPNFGGLLDGISLYREKKISC